MAPTDGEDEKYYSKELMLLWKSKKEKGHYALEKKEKGKGHYHFIAAG